MKIIQAQGTFYEAVFAMVNSGEFVAVVPSGYDFTFLANSEDALKALLTPQAEHRPTYLLE